MKDSWLTPQFHVIPELLQQHARWVLWTVDGSGRKVPRSAAKPAKNIDGSKASNWATFAEATSSATKHAQGIGFALGHVQDGPTFAGVDLDKCRNPETGVIDEWAMKIVRYLDSYTEISPSGTGVKVFLVGALKDEAKQGKIYKLEIYDRGRYFTLTGHHLGGTKTTVEYRDEQLKALHEGAWQKDLVKLMKLFGFFISESADWVNIHCPWRDNHSGGHQDRDAGLKLDGGKVVGFNCFHAGCSEKTLGDVRGLFGLKGGHTSDFITDAEGKILAREQENIRRAIVMLGAKLEHDTFANKMFLANGVGRRPLDDAAADRLYLSIESSYRFSPPKDYYRMVVEDEARFHPVNPVLDYITKLVWDGVPRLEKWLIDFGGAKDTEFVRAVSRIVLVAAVRRVRQPGSLFQEMLVLESSQGQSKSTSIAALCPHDDWFSDDLPLNVDAKQLIERTSGKWIIEASDLSGMRKGDIEHLKAMLSRCVDGPVRMAYDHFPLERPRAFILIGTTNSSLYLKDPTGGRRFWPVRVGMFQIDLLRAVRDQLWAEAAHYEGRGESIRLAQNLWGDAAKEQEQRRVVDTWEEILRDSDIDFTASHVPSDSIWALLGASHSDPRNAERLAPIMQHLGYPRKHRCRYNGRNGMHWVREDAEFELVAERPDFIQRSEN